MVITPSSSMDDQDKNNNNDSSNSQSDTDYGYDNNNNNNNNKPSIVKRQQTLPDNHWMQRNNNEPKMTSRELRRRFSLQHMPSGEQDIQDMVMGQLRDKLAKQYVGHHQVIERRGLGIEYPKAKNNNHMDANVLGQLKGKLDHMYTGNQLVIESTSTHERIQKPRPKLGKAQSLRKKSFRSRSHSPSMMVTPPSPSKQQQQPEAPVSSPEQSRDPAAGDPQSDRRMMMRKKSQRSMRRNSTRSLSRDRDSCRSLSSGSDLNNDENKDNSRRSSPMRKSQRRSRKPKGVSDSKRAQSYVTQGQVYKVLAKVAVGGGEKKERKKESSKRITTTKKVWFSPHVDDGNSLQSQLLHYHVHDKADFYAGNCYWWTKSELHAIEEECQNLSSYCGKDQDYVQALHTLLHHDDESGNDQKAMEEAALQLWKLPARGLERMILQNTAQQLIQQHTASVLQARKEMKQQEMSASSMARQLRKHSRTTSRLSGSLASALANLDVEGAVGAYLERNPRSSYQQPQQQHGAVKGEKRGPRRHSMHN